MIWRYFTNNHINNYISLGSLSISMLSFFISYLIYIEQNRISYTTKMLINHVEYSDSSGRLGSGPQFILGVSFINNGNRPVLIRRIYVSFGEDLENGNFLPDCSIAEGRFWVASPWSNELDKDNLFHPISRSVSPHSIHTALFQFEPLSLKKGTDNDAENYTVCMRVEALDGNGENHSLFKKARRTTTFSRTG